MSRWLNTGSSLSRSIADRAVPIVVGYANGHIGYIATAEAHKFGGYEPTQSPLLPAAEVEILRGLNRLADRVIGDVFESFSKHPAWDEAPDEVKRRLINGLVAIVLRRQGAVGPIFETRDSGRCRPFLAAVVI